MNKVIIVALLATLLAGCAHDSPCVPVYDSEGRLVHTITCMKGTTQDNWKPPARLPGRSCRRWPDARHRGVDSLIPFFSLP